MDVHSLLAEIAQAHLLRWQSAHFQVGEMLAIGHKYQVTMGLKWAASVIIWTLSVSQDSAYPGNAATALLSYWGFSLQANSLR